MYELNILFIKIWQVLLFSLPVVGFLGSREHVMAHCF